MAISVAEIRDRQPVLLWGLAGLAAGACLIKRCVASRETSKPILAPPGIKYGTMRNEEYGFEVKHPVGWTVHEYAQRGSVDFQFIHPESPSIMIELVLEELKDEIDLKTYAQQARSNTVKQLETLQEFTIHEEPIPKDKVVEIRGHETAQWQIAMTSNDAEHDVDMSYKTWNCVCIHGRYGWGLLVSTNSADFDETMTYAKAMASSLVFTEPSR